MLYINTKRYKIKMCAADNKFCGRAEKEFLDDS